MSINDPSSQSALISKLIGLLNRHPKRVVFTEGEDLRVLKAAVRMVELEIIVPILLGNVGRIQSLAKEHKLPLTFIRIIDPKTSSDLPLFLKRAENMARYRSNNPMVNEEILSRPHNFGAMMVQYGHADAILGGNIVIPAYYFRALIQNIKPKASVPRIFGVTILETYSLPESVEKKTLFFTDTGLNPNPDVNLLAAIATETGKLALQLLGRTPVVNLLSHSTKGSAHTPEARKIVAATALAKDQIEREYLDIILDGELQADVAIDPMAAEVKLLDASARACADVLVFPNLDAAHISIKLLQHLGRAQNYGQIILGLTRPAAQVPRTSSVDTIFGTAVIVAVESIKYRELYLDSDFQN